MREAPAYRSAADLEAKMTPVSKTVTHGVQATSSLPRTQFPGSRNTMRQQP